MLSLLVSKVLRKTAELSEKLPDTRHEQVVSPEPKPIPLPKVQKKSKRQIPPKPEMTAEAVAYPKLHKIYNELVRQNETIFAAEEERNALEDKQSNLKGLSKLTKKGELQSEIDRINERIALLKVGLSGIAKQYGYQTVQDFYRAYHIAKNAYADYLEKASRWEKLMEQRKRVIPYMTEYRIIKGKVQTVKWSKLLKAGTEGRGNVPLLSNYPLVFYKSIGTSVFS